jgi:hypothetical protein
MKILLDTNFLIIPGKNRVDIFSELRAFGRPELFTIGLVREELRKLASESGVSASHARLALELIKKKKVKVLSTGGSDADSELERLASEGDFVVCTQDRELQARLRKEGVAVIYLRQGRLLGKM